MGRFRMMRAARWIESAQAFRAPAARAAMAALVEWPLETVGDIISIVALLGQKLGGGMRANAAAANQINAVLPGHR